jgi:hypothetical protein
MTPLADQVKAALAEKWPVPVPARELTEALGLTGALGRLRVWRSLTALEKRGEAERIRVADSRSPYWRAAGEPAAVDEP